MFDAHSGWGMGMGMWLFWIVVIIIAVVLVKVIGSGSSTTSTEKSPMEILKARYARGEIDEEEFNRRRNELEK